MTFRYKNRFDKERRDFLKVVSAAGVCKGLLAASPLVSGMLLGRVAEAQQSKPRKSFFILHTGGALDKLWRPNGNLRLGPQSAPYEPVKNDINFVVGASVSAAGHGIMHHRFNDGSFRADSIDVNLGRTISSNYPLKYLNLGAETGAMNLSRQEFTSIPTIDEPRSAFSRMMGAASAPAGAPTAGGAVAENPRVTILDLHKNAMDALQRKLGQHEKVKLDNHLTAIREFEDRLAPAMPGEGAGNAPGANLEPLPEVCPNFEMPKGSSGNFDATCKLQLEIALLALKCNITASASLAFGSDQHTFSIPGYGELHRSHHCCADSEGEYTKTVSYMSGLCARTVSRAKEEGVLNDTVITQVCDMGDARGHANGNVPLFITGAGIRRGTVTNASGKSTRNLFGTVAAHLGATEHPDARAWGDPIAGITA